MASLGTDAATGKPLADFDHVVQSIGIILTTGIGERVMREWFGYPGLALLGELANEQTILRFWNAVVTALTVLQVNGLPTEPRFRIVKINSTRIDRSGLYEVQVEGDYMPRGHLGDFTVDSRRSMRVIDGDKGLRATA
jgi:phage baseplate assembly protein W